MADDNKKHAHKRMDYTEIIAATEKKFGKSLVGYASQLPRKLTFIPTGIYELDQAMGGGIPRGKKGMIWGTERAGKTTLCFAIMAAHQRTCRLCGQPYTKVKTGYRDVTFPNGDPIIDDATGEVLQELYFEERSGCKCADGIGEPMTVAFIDAEDSFDPQWAELWGIVLSEVKFINGWSMEYALYKIEELMFNELADLIIIDSLAQLNPEIENTKNLDDGQSPSSPKIIGRALKRITSIYLKMGINNPLKPSMVFINQKRYKIGLKFGNPETFSGGEQSKHTPDWRIKLSGTGTIKDEGTGYSYGSGVKAVVEKYKNGIPFRQAEYIIHTSDFAQLGIHAGTTNVAFQILNAAVQWGIIEKKGSWFSYNGEQVGQGAAKVVAFLKESPHIEKEILQELNRFENEFRTHKRSAPNEMIADKTDEDWVDPDTDIEIPDSSEGNEEQ